MFQNSKNLVFALLFLSILVNVSCKKDDPDPIVIIENVAPTVKSTLPVNASTNVERNVQLSILFSEEMDEASISEATFQLKKGSVSLSGSVSFSGTSASFSPNEYLDPSSTYTATITVGAKDLEGKSLSNATVWNFTTGGTSATLAQVDLGGAANYVILAKTAINNSATSAITGHLGLSPAATSYITGLSLVNATGYATSAQVTGNIYAADLSEACRQTLLKCAMPSSSHH
jgi:hypothetical protein